jgi:hypothetical protein
MNLVSKPTENQFNSPGNKLFFVRIFLDKICRFFFKGQDILPLTFKLYPQRSESVDNGNRISPTNNGLQRV